MGETAVGPRHRIPSLDGLRAFAILCVLYGHGVATYSDQPQIVKQIAWYLPIGDFGVQIFFVLSGFLITMLLMEEKASTGRISLKDFYRRRAYRILPALYAFLAVVGVLMVFGKIDISPWLLASAAFFIRDYVPAGGNWWLGHTWSLAVEEQFYLLWPLLFLAARKRNLANLLAAGIVVVVVVRLVTYVFLPPLREGISVMFHTRADALMVGCLLALSWNHASFQSLARRSLQRGLGYIAIGWVLVSWHMTRVSRDWWHVTVGYMGDALAIAVLMTWAVLRPRSIGGRMLNNRLVRHVGVLSYSLYLWQQLFLTTENDTWAGSFPLNVVVVFAVAECSYWLVERPFLALRKRRDRASVIDLTTPERVDSSQVVGIPAGQGVVP